MEININPSDIDQYVKNAVLESTIGKNIKESTEKAIKDLFSGYHNPVPGIVNRILENIVKEYLEQESVKPIIFDAVAKQVTPEVIGDIVKEGCYQLRKRFEDR